uniref:Integrase catalytic domain-containing protein n=1 Tax=Tanacetum cinerariifolium TaxID=118510 RepID=A0A6L2P0I1_TANCI|nr:hypothetical protein [Tanacetum cinerariifolium]
MADLAFAPQHNMVAYLEKTEGNAEFHQIVDFLTSSSIHHTLTVSPTIYASNLEQFWNTTKSQTINDEKHIHVIVDGKTVVITESSVKRDLLFTDDNGITCLTNSYIFENLPLMGGPNFFDPSVDVEAVHKEGGKGSDSGLGCQETIGGAMAQIRFEVHLYSPVIHLSQQELTDLCTTLSQKVLDLENVKTAQAKEIAILQKRVTKLEQRQSSRILDFHPFRAEEVIVEDKGSGEKGGSTAKTVSTARPDISATRPEVSTAKPKTPPITTALFDDEYVTIVDTLNWMKKSGQKEKRQEEASKDALVELYNEVQAHIDADHELAVRLTPEEKEKYTVEERFTHTQLKSRSFKEIQKLYTKEHKWVDAFVPICCEEDEKRVGRRKKRAACSSLKQKSPKKKKVNDQEFIDSDKELMKWLKVVLDDDKVINYKTLDVKSQIVDCESQVLGTMVAGDVHVYKLTRLDESYRHFLTFSRMLEVLDRQDLLDLHKIVMESEDDEIWRNQQDWKLLSWKLYETYEVHTLILDDSLVFINMFVEKRLKKSKVFGYILLVIMKLILKKFDFHQVKIKFRGGLLGYMLFRLSTVSYRSVSTASLLVEIIIFIVDSGCSKHMTRNLKLLSNFVEKFLGIVKFRNDQIAPILSYGDLSTCYIHDLKGNDLLTGSRGTDLYFITLQDTSTPNPICLMAKASSSQAWLWHRHLSHLNFDTINLLSKYDIVTGLSKLKFIKDHLCSSCELRKAKSKSFKTKTTPSSKRRLHILHMDLCGPMRIESFNGKKYVLLVEIIIFIVDSGCSKHMTRNLKLLSNFVEKFLGIVKFRNDQIAPILSYGDLSTCYIHDLKGNDLLTGSRGTDLYFITLQDTSTPNPICLMAKASSSQAWLWHRHLSHLNFDTINLLSKYDIVTGLSKLKFIKDHLCSSCELRKAKSKSFKTKTTPSSKRRLHILHMDLCGPMRIESFNGKKYVLVIVGDYSRYTWTHFLRSKDETPKVLIDFFKLVQRGLHAQVRTVRTHKGIEFLNKTLHAYFAQEGIEHQTSTARTLYKTELSNDGTILLLRDGKNLYKMKEKGDACIFVGYSTQLRAYRLYKKRTRVIVETIHINFDELPHMASDHVSSDFVPQCPTTALKQGSLSLGSQSQQAETVTTSNELDFLFSLMFDELLNDTNQVVSKSSTVTTADAFNQRQQQNITLSTATTIDADIPPLNIQKHIKLQVKHQL